MLASHILWEIVAETESVWGQILSLDTRRNTPQNRETCSWCSQVQTGSKARSHGGAVDCTLGAPARCAVNGSKDYWRCSVHGCGPLTGMLGLWIPGCRLPWQSSSSDTSLPLQVAQVWSLVGESRSWISEWHSQKVERKKKKGIPSLEMWRRERQWWGECWISRLFPVFRFCALIYLDWPQLAREVNIKF